MRASRWNEEGISRLHREPRKAPLDIGIIQRLTENFRRDAGLQSEPEFGARPCSDGIPHFCLTRSPRRSFVLAGIFVIRMNLDGELFFREEEL